MALERVPADIRREGGVARMVRFVSSQRSLVMQKPRSLTPPPSLDPLLRL
jgi:pyridoxal biosynthesis lyase PdxS